MRVDMFVMRCDLSLEAISSLLAFHVGFRKSVSQQNRFKGTVRALIIRGLRSSCLTRLSHRPLAFDAPCVQYLFSQNPSACWSLRTANQ